MSLGRAKGGIFRIATLTNSVASQVPQGRHRLIEKPMPRFVVLEHDHPALHWDLMLEASGVLQTWRLDQPPDAGSGSIDATEVSDHRVAYLDYEGPVSGNRGRVRRWDAGDFDEAAESLPDVRVFTLRGVRARGRVQLERVAGTKWRFLWQSE